MSVCLSIGCFVRLFDGVCLSVCFDAGCFVRVFDCKLSAFPRVI